ncbi:MAG: RNA 2',3'-cyclic phosphodiesterase [Nitrospiria bacterium]
MVGKKTFTAGKQSTTVSPMRLFIAFPISETIRKRYRELQDRGRKQAVSIRWCRPEQCHLTLLFLGEIKASDLGAIEEILRSTVAQFTPFTVTITGLGLFPKPKAPRVLWLGVSEEASLMRLQQSLADAIGRLGLPLERRSFRPHLTLARIRGKIEPVPGALFRWMKQEADVNIGPCKMESLILVQSRLSPQGASYQTLLTLPLGERHVEGRATDASRF